MSVLTLTPVTPGSLDVIPYDDMPTDETARDKWEATYGDVKYTARAVVNLRFDDSKATDYSVVFPELTSRALPAAFALTTSYLNPPGTGLTVAQVLEMQANGMEFLTHSASHGADPATATAFLAETKTPRDTMVDAGIYADGFVQPGTWVGAHNYDAASKMDGTLYGWYFRDLFAQVSAYIDDDQGATLSGVRSLPCRRRFGWHHRTVETLNQTQLQAALDFAISYGGALQMMWHSLNIGSVGYTTLAQFQGFLDYLVTKRNQGLVDVRSACGMTFARYGTAQNWIGDGTFALSATGAFVVWTTVGAPTVDAAGDGGGNAANVDTSAYIQQIISAHNLRSLAFSASVKNAAAGVAATAQVQFFTYDTNGNQLGSTVSVTKACADTYATMRATFGLRADAAYLKIICRTNGANNAYFSNVQMTKL